MKKTKQNDVTSAERRKSLEADVEKFLQAGNKIDYIDTGVSSQENAGRPPKSGNVKTETPAPAPAPANSDADKPAAQEDPKS